MSNNNIDVTWCNIGNPYLNIYTLWWTNIAIENGPVEIVDFPSYKVVDLSIAMLVHQRVYPIKSH